MSFTAKSLAAVTIITMVTACAATIDNSRSPYIAVANGDSSMQARITGPLTLTKKGCLGVATDTSVNAVAWPKGIGRSGSGISYHGHVYRPGDWFDGSGGAVSAAAAAKSVKIFPTQCHAASVTVLGSMKPMKKP